MTNFNFNELTVPERIELIADIWDSIEQDQLPPVTDAQRLELERRVEDFRRNPAEGATWEEVKARIQARK